MPAVHGAGDVGDEEVTQLTDHFSLEELTFSSTAQRMGIDNTPTPDIVERLRFTAAGLEKIRALLGQPMRIDSGYRCPRLNGAVGGVGHSAHMDGDAADFVCPAFGTPLEVARAIAASPIQFDQLIQEGTWVHVSFAPAMRRQVLTASFGPTGASYRSGL